MNNITIKRLLIEYNKSEGKSDKPNIQKNHSYAYKFPVFFAYPSL